MIRILHYTSAFGGHRGGSGCAAAASSWMTSSSFSRQLGSKKCSLLLFANTTATTTSRRFFIQKLLGRKSAPKVTVETAVFDKTSSHFAGKFLGIPMDAIVFYSKVGGAVFVVWFIVHLFFKGYAYLTDFSLHTVARLGFMGGFMTCAVLYTLALQLRHRIQINPNAVYNQSISLVMRNSTALEFLGPHPRTGDFKAYCATGGFKLPLLRRLRSGSYEIGDLLGLKPRRLQMMFILRNPANGREGLVTVDVQKEQSGFMRSTDTFRSLAVTLSDTATSTGEQKTLVIIGRPEDVVYRGFMKL